MRIQFLFLLIAPCIFLANFNPQTVSSAEISRSANSTVSKDVYYQTEGIVSGPAAPDLNRHDYPTSNLPSLLGESRLIIWFIAQQHLYFGSFVLGVLFLILLFEIRGLAGKDKVAARWYDRLALKLLDVVLVAISLAAILGGLLIFGFVTLYPDFFRYLAGMFKPWMHLYAVLFLVFVLAVYFYLNTWPRMKSGVAKGAHVTIGLFANVLGTTMMFLANSWSTYMMSPAGVDMQGRFLGHSWNLLNNALWNPLNIHRFTSNIIFGSAMIGAYAAYSALSAKNQDDRAYYDKMGYVSFISMIAFLATIPYGGYWLSREIYSYRQQMGITMFGGLLAWLNVVLVSLMSMLFLGINYYIWQRIDCVEGGDRYRYHAKYVFFVLTACIFVYITPHTLVMTSEELSAIGGQQHPVFGNFGVESAKQSSIHIMVIITTWSLLLLWRSQYHFERSRHALGNTVLAGFFLAGITNIIWLGIYGYYVPAMTRVGMVVPMVITTLSTIVIGSAITYVMIVRIKDSRPIASSSLSARGHIALLFIAVTISWIMGLGGYMRSSLRLYWHATEIFRDNSPWAFTYPLGFAANVITVNALLFWCGFLFMISLTNLRD
jgi:cytochrome bd ubiquinol oxidase subunit I